MSITYLNERPTIIVKSGMGPGILYNRDPKRPIFIGRDGSIVYGNENSGSILDPLASLYVAGDTDIFAVAPVGTTANDGLPVDFIHAGRSQYHQSATILSQPLADLNTSIGTVNDNLTEVINQITNIAGVSGLTLIQPPTQIAGQTTANQVALLNPVAASFNWKGGLMLIQYRLSGNAPFGQAAFWARVDVRLTPTGPTFQIQSYAHLYNPATGGAYYDEGATSGLAIVNVPAGTYAPQIQVSTSQSGWQIESGELSFFQVGTASSPVPPTPTPSIPTFNLPPSAYGLVAWTYNPDFTQTGASSGSGVQTYSIGTMPVVRINSFAGGLVSNIRISAFTINTGMTVQAAIYSDDGQTQLGITSVVTVPATQPNGTNLPLATPVTLVAGTIYRVAILPLVQSLNMAGPIVAAGNWNMSAFFLPPAAQRATGQITGQTSIPATIDPTTLATGPQNNTPPLVLLL